MIDTEKVTCVSMFFILQSISRSNCCSCGLHLYLSIQKEGQYNRYRIFIENMNYPKSIANRTKKGEK